MVMMMNDGDHDGGNTQRLRHFFAFSSGGRSTTEMDYCAILNRVLPKDIRAVAWTAVTPGPLHRLPSHAPLSTAGRRHLFSGPPCGFLGFVFLDLSVMHCRWLRVSLHDDKDGGRLGW